MNKLYIQSNFHLPSIKSLPSLPEDISSLLAPIYNFETQELYVSDANLDTLEKLQESDDVRLSTDAKTYFLAISCDMEVAMQAQQLQRMAVLSKFEYINIATSSPILHYLAPPPELSLSIEPPEMFEGNIYVINTHGKPGELDGIYENAIYNNLSINRIVIDACSSACRGPKKTPSMVEVLLDLAIKTHMPSSFEVVGFYKSYSIDETRMLTCAILGKRDFIDNYSCEVCDETVADRKEKIKQEVAKLTAKKAQRAKTNPMESSLDKVFLSSASYLSSILLPKAIFLNEKGKMAMPGHFTDPQLELLNFSHNRLELLNQIKDLIGSHPTSSSSFVYNGIIKLIKRSRSHFIESTPREALVEQAKKLLDILELLPQDSHKLQDHISKIQNLISLSSSNATDHTLALSPSGTISTNSDSQHRFLAAAIEPGIFKNPNVLFRSIEATSEINGCIPTKDRDLRTPKKSP